MKLNNPNQIALFIAACITVIGLGTILFIEWILNTSFPWYGWGIFIIMSFGASFGLTWWAIEEFLHGKIKMLYRSIQSPEKIEAKIKDVTKSRDALGVVQKDVEAWASGKQSEIQSLKEQAKFRRDFIGNLAHELKTPIFNMQGYLLTLIEGGLEDPKINYDYLSRADKNLERLIALVEDLDSISKLEAGREMLRLERVNLLDICEEIFGLFDLRAEEKNIDLRFNKKYDKPIWVKIDREKIVQVLSNLVLNAIYYGKYDGYCEIRILDMQQNVLVEVADDGIGVQPEDLPRLFERFYRVDKSRSRNQGGTGLGLAIVKHIIESHGQSINVRSVVDKGTTFSFTLEKAK
ncbi:MAG: ATP-binding protein [Flavobacteriales bacterium]